MFCLTSKTTNIMGVPIKKFTNVNRFLNLIKQYKFFFQFKENSYNVVIFYIKRLSIAKLQKQ